MPNHRILNRSSLAEFYFSDIVYRAVCRYQCGTWTVTVTSREDGLPIARHCYNLSMPQEAALLKALLAFAHEREIEIKPLKLEPEIG